MELVEIDMKVQGTFFLTEFDVDEYSKSVWGLLHAGYKIGNDSIIVKIILAIETDLFLHVFNLPVKALINLWKVNALTSK